MAKPGLQLDQGSVKRVFANIRREGEKFDKKAAGALYLEGQEILARSRAEFVPVDKGILRADSGVTSPQRGPGGPEVGIWYGNGPAKAYAVVQHERLDFQHKVGGPKYLERPVLEAVSNLARRLAARMR